MEDDDFHSPFISILTIIMVIAVVIYELVTVTIEWGIGEIKRPWRKRGTETELDPTRLRP